MHTRFIQVIKKILSKHLKTTIKWVCVCVCMSSSPHHHQHSTIHISSITKSKSYNLISMEPTEMVIIIWLKRASSSFNGGGDAGKISTIIIRICMYTYYIDRWWWVKQFVELCRLWWVLVNIIILCMCYTA